MRLHITLQIKGVVADDYAAAAKAAFLHAEEYASDVLVGVLASNPDEWEQEFIICARVARECDGTFTVTIP